MMMPSKGNSTENQTRNMASFTALNFMTQYINKYTYKTLHVRVCLGKDFYQLSHVLDICSM